eukprot:1497700-Rhodomonas_salina.5
MQPSMSLVVEKIKYFCCRTISVYQGSSLVPKRGQSRWSLRHLRCDCLYFGTVAAYFHTRTGKRIVVQRPHWTGAANFALYFPQLYWSGDYHWKSGNWKRADFPILKS